MDSSVTSRLLLVYDCVKEAEFLLISQHDVFEVLWRLVGLTRLREERESREHSLF